MSRTVVFDIETDGLDATRVWVIVCKDIDTNEVFVFKNPSDNPQPFKEFSNDVDRWIAHNGIGFDCYWTSVLCGVETSSRCIDTLVLSRLWYYKLKGGHSLNAWGKRLADSKGDYSDWSQLTDEMVEYCVQDVELTHKVYDYLKKKVIDNKSFTQAIETEHEMARICEQMSRDGFKFNREEAEKDYKKISKAIEHLDLKLQEAFPPRKVVDRVVIPKLTKHGTISKVNMKWYDGDDYTIFTPGVPYTVYKDEVFNPGSPRQVVTRLNEAGWKPTEKTKGHLDFLKLRSNDTDKRDHYKKFGWKVSETNLATLPSTAPEGSKYLSNWLLLKSRQRKLEEWIALTTCDGYIHGKFTSIGTWPHRMSHQRPNMGNPPRVSSPYGSRFRSYWCTESDEWLVGVDASGIQLRILAHYINDAAFTYAVCEGREEDGTDIHTVNQKNLGSVCASRNKAKTFIYAWLLGASPTKVAEIFGCSIAEAKLARDQFIAAYTGLPYLKDEVIPADALRGYFVGLDGRWVACDSEHLMLAGYLQNGESTIMKMATIIWMKELDKLNIDYTLRNLVHDEWQVSVRGSKETAQRVGEAMVAAIREVGTILQLNCPLDGGIKIGKNWMETH